MRSETFAKLFPAYQDKKNICGPMIAADHLAYLLDIPVNEVCRSGHMLADGLLKAQQIYKSDFIIVFFDVSVEAEALGVKLEYPVNSNPFPVKYVNLPQVEASNPLQKGRIPQLFIASQKCRQVLGKDFPIFISMKDPFSLAALAAGTDDFLMLTITDPEQAVKLLQKMTAVQLILLREIINRGFIPFIGSPIGSGSLISAGSFRKFVQPYLEELFAEAASLSSFRCLHICGEIRDFTEPLKELCPDLLSIERFNGEMWKYLDSTVAMGYVNTELFYSGSIDKLRKAAAECKSSMPEPYVFSSGCDLPAKADVEAVKVMMK